MVLTYGIIHGITAYVLVCTRPTHFHVLHFFPFGLKAAMNPVGIRKHTLSKGFDCVKAIVELRSKIQSQDDLLERRIFKFIGLYVGDYICT